MSMTYNADGQRYALYSKPSDGTLTTVATLSTFQAGSLDRVIIAPNSSGANASIVVNDGSVDRYLIRDKAIAANVPLNELLEYPLMEDYVLKVQSSVGSELEFHLIIAEEFRISSSGMA